MKKKTLFSILLAALVLAALAALGFFISGRSSRSSQTAQEAAARSSQMAESLHQILGEDSSEAVESQTDGEGLIEVLSSGSWNGSVKETLSEEEAESEGTEDILFEEESKEASEADLLSRTAQRVQISASDAYRQEDYPLPAEHQLIFVGDSRTVGAGEAEAGTQDTCLFIGESGEGYRWFAETGRTLMEDAIAEYPDVPVVFNLGVNDCDAIDSYIALYREILTASPDTSFYFMSVNPVTEESLHVPDSDVQAFNEKLREAFPEQYIDTYTWMTTYGYVSVDGVHYSYEQYRAIHDYAVRAVFGLEQPQVGLRAEEEEWLTETAGPDTVFIE